MCVIKSNQIKNNRFCKFWIEPLSLANNNGFAPKELDSIRRIIELNLTRILEALRPAVQPNPRKRLPNGKRQSDIFMERFITSLSGPSEEENLRLWVLEAERRLVELFQFFCSLSKVFYVFKLPLGCSFSYRGPFILATRKPMTKPRANSVTTSIT